MKLDPSGPVTDAWLVSYLTAVCPWPPCDRRPLDGLEYVDRVGRWLWQMHNVAPAAAKGELRL